MLSALAAAAAEPPAAPAWPGAGAAGETVQAELLCDSTAIAAGSTFRLGVLLTIKPAWHVYWKNPGDSGAATEIKFTLPEGFTVSPLRWPAPLRMELPGNIVNFGYERQVLLSVEVQAPTALAAGPVAAQAEVSWSACNSEQCVLGQASLRSSLKTADRQVPDRDAQTIFGHWDKTLPVTAAQAGLTVRVEGGIVPPAGSGSVTIRLSGLKLPAGAAVVIDAPGNVVIEKAVIKPDPSDGARITFNAKTPGKAAPPAKMEVVVVYPGDDGRQHGIRLDVPLMAAMNKT